jgi:hypothetical protein
MSHNGSAGDLGGGLDDEGSRAFQKSEVFWIGYIREYADDEALSRYDCGVSMSGCIFGSVVN